MSGKVKGDHTKSYCGVYDEGLLPEEKALEGVTPSFKDVDLWGIEVCLWSRHRRGFGNCQVSEIEAESLDELGKKCACHQVVLIELFASPKGDDHEVSGWVLLNTRLGCKFVTSFFMERAILGKEVQVNDSGRPLGGSPWPIP